MLVTVHVHTADIAQGLPGHIVARRSQPPAHNHDIRPAGTLPHRLANGITVGNHGLPLHAEPRFKQPVPQPCRIRIHNASQQNLRTGVDQLNPHILHASIMLPSLHSGMQQSCHVLQKTSFELPVG